MTRLSDYYVYVCLFILFQLTSIQTGSKHCKISEMKHKFFQFQLAGRKKMSNNSAPIVIGAFECLISGVNRSQAESFLLSIELQPNFVAFLFTLIDSRQNVGRDIRFVFVNLENCVLGI